MESKQEKKPEHIDHSEKSMGMEINLKRYFCRFWCTSVKNGDVVEPTLNEPLLKSPEKK